MRAEYESSADLLVIQLERPAGSVYGELLPGGPIVEFDESDRIVALELTSASGGTRDRLEVAATRGGVKLAVLEAITALALDNPDSAVSLTSEVHTGRHLSRT